MNFRGSVFRSFEWQLCQEPLWAALGVLQWYHFTFWIRCLFLWSQSIWWKLAVVINPRLRFQKFYLPYGYFVTTPIHSWAVTLCIQTATPFHRIWPDLPQVKLQVGWLLFCGPWLSTPSHLVDLWPFDYLQQRFHQYRFVVILPQLKV